MIREIETLVYKGSTHTVGGREGTGRSSDGELDVKLSAIGSNKPGTNPEQLLGVGYSACFMGAMRRAATPLDIKIPDDVSIDADVSLGRAADGGFALGVKLTVNLPGLEASQKQKLIDGAHQLCPYSLALKDSIAVELRYS